MPPVKPLRRSIVDVLAEYLRGLEDDDSNPLFTTVIEGWPEYSVTRNLGLGTLASVDIAGKIRIRKRSPVLAAERAGVADHTGVGTIYTGEWRGTVQVSVWADYKEALEHIMVYLPGALQPGLPWTAGLSLLMDDYFGAYMGVMDDHTEEPPQATKDHERGGWRLVWDLAVYGDEFEEYTSPTQDVIHIVTETTIAGASSTAVEDTTVIEEIP